MKKSSWLLLWKEKKHNQHKVKKKKKIDFHPNNKEKVYIEWTKERKEISKKKEIKEKKKFVSNLLAKYNHTKTITNFFWFNLETGVDIKTSQKYSLYFLIVGVLTSSEIYQKRLNVLNINLRFSGKTKSDLICFLVFSAESDRLDSVFRFFVRLFELISTQGKIFRNRHTQEY